MILRAKTKTLFQGKPMTKSQQDNSDLNLRELEDGAVKLKSLPRRVVLELTNACNLNCIMCGRNAANFKLTQFKMDWFYSLESLFDVIEEVTLMGWGEPTIHPCFVEMLQVINRHAARKYFCTNGMRLDRLTNAIFDHAVDVFAVSVDGASPETNSAIRRGSDLIKINNDLRRIVQIKRSNNLTYPYINYVFCAMKRNLDELPQMVEMAAEVGLEEVKVVYLTAFNDVFAVDTLYDCPDKVASVFEAAKRRADELGVLLKLPYVQGDDPAGVSPHRDCYVAYRDFFIGSDGYVRPCMSTADKMLAYAPDINFKDIWNAQAYQRYRASVNSPNMPINCYSCYQSSHCNWNNKKSHIQANESFAPEWEDH